MKRSGIRGNKLFREIEMVLYRRNRIAGGTYFFTVALQDRHCDLLIRHIADLRLAFQRTKTKQLFRINAFVILPEHLHVVFTLPSGDDNYPARWRSIKAIFTRQLLTKEISLTSNVKGEYNLWQRRYWEHTIHGEKDMVRHMDYIHYNPVKHGLAARVLDWPYSSFHEYVRRGILDKQWAGDGSKVEGSFGE